jgi:phosphoribosyl-ATP pyrophosphohydrolase
VRGDYRVLTTLVRIQATPPGATEVLCEFPELTMANFTLHDLAARVKERAQASPDVSYTRKLIDRGIAHCAKKLGEEAVETTIAAVAEDRDRLIAETADLLYHLFVVLEVRDISLAEVEAALAERTAQSGLDEKAGRPRV